MREPALALLLPLLLSAPSAAQTPACDALDGSLRSRAQRILSSEHPYDCCDDTLLRCLDQRPTCALAVRLAEDVCRRVAEGQDEGRVRRALSRRARSMVGGGPPAAIDLSSAAVAGRAEAPVTVVVYACARCPYCSRLVPALHREVTSGRLRGQARLAFRTFPIRGHEGSTEAGLAFAAAEAMGRFWEVALASYAEFDAVGPERSRERARRAGLDPDAFAARQADPATRELLVASKKEGIANGVEETPTLFVNGRRWTGELTLGAVVDAVEEEAERVRGIRWARR